jgi:hypothetical protein
MAEGGASGGASPSAGPCDGRAGETICNQAVMRKCSPSGTVLSEETCMSEAHCQFGLSSGQCAVCTFGAFQCAGSNKSDLEKCSDAGQYERVKSCDSAALCKAAAGACTDKVCTPNTKVCSDDSTLQTCNADGSQLTNPQPCGDHLCDMNSGMCLKCVPNATGCDGDIATKCSTDGLTLARTQCTAPECMMATCSAGKCATVPMPASVSKCSSGGVCDGQGHCVACVDDADCGSNAVCSGRTCLSKLCTSNEATCAPDGTLQTCNAAGTALSSKPCGARNLCDPVGKKCYACVPGSATCDSGTTLRHCSSDGVTASVETCTTNATCYVAACSNNACETTPAPAGGSCGLSGGRCDGTGACGICGDGIVQRSLGEECEPINDAYGCDVSCKKATLYTHCTSSSECLGGLTCLANSGALANLCTRQCQSSGDCPSPASSAVGVTVSCDAGYCFLHCRNDGTGTCPPSKSCIGGGGAIVCGQN